MALLDFLTSSGSNAPSQESEGLMSKLNYGGVPFGVRLMAAAEALRTINNPNISRPSLALLARSKEQSDAEKKEARLKAEKQITANRLADKLSLTNPELAEIIRSDPELVDEYMKGSIAEGFQSKRDERNRDWAIEDRNANADLTREGWGVQDTRSAADNAAQASLAEANDARDMEKERLKAQLEEDKAVAKSARDQAMAEGNLERAKMITDGFFEVNRVPLDEPAAGPAPIPAPLPSPVKETVPRTAPGLLQTEGPAPEEEGDAAEAPPQQVSIWREKLADPAINANEAALLTTAFKSAITAAAVEGKPPTAEAGMAAVNEVYMKLKKTRADDTTAQAAADTVTQKEAAADLTGRTERAATTDTTLKTSEIAKQGADNTLNAIGDVEAAVADAEKSGRYLPAIGWNSYMTSFISETNARAVYNAVNTVKSNVSLGKLLELKEASPTGASGLGALNLKELQTLENVIASLDPTDDKFLDNMSQVKKLYSDIQIRNEDYADNIRTLREEPTAENIKDFDKLYGVDSHLKFIGAQ